MVCQREALEVVLVRIASRAPARRAIARLPATLLAARLEAVFRLSTDRSRFMTMRATRSGFS